MNLIIRSIPTLSTEGLYALAQDCEQRIGSHVAGGMPNDIYVEGQRRILLAIQDELADRRKS